MQVKKGTVNYNVKKAQQMFSTDPCVQQEWKDLDGGALNLRRMRI